MRLFVAMPCMDMIHTEFFKSVLAMTVPPKTQYGITMATLVYDARNMLAKQALDYKADRILWLDSDMVFPHDIIERLGADLDEGKQMVSALYFTRKNPVKPCVFKTLRYDIDGENIIPKATDFQDYPRNDIFSIAACGFGCCMMTGDLLANVTQKYGAPFVPIAGYGEDLSFCQRVGELGEHIYCDSKIKCSHVGMYHINEDTFDKGITL